MERKKSKKPRVEPPRGECPGVTGQGRNCLIRREAQESTKSATAIRPVSTNGNRARAAIPAAGPAAERTSGSTSWSTWP